MVRSSCLHLCNYIHFLAYFKGLPPSCIIAPFLPLSDILHTCVQLSPPSVLVRSSDTAVPCVVFHQYLLLVAAPWISLPLGLTNTIELN